MLLTHATPAVHSATDYRRSPNASSYSSVARGRLHRRLGSGRWDGRVCAHQRRPQRHRARSRRTVGQHHRLRHAHLALRIAAARRLDARQAVRRIRRLHRRLGASGRAVHRRPGREIPLVARPHGRRPNQSLGSHLAAVRAARLQEQVDRRAGRRLADQLRRCETLLREGRAAGGGLRQQREPAQRAGQHLPAGTEAALLRIAGAAGRAAPERHLRPVAPVDPD